MNEEDVCEQCGGESPHAALCEYCACYNEQIENLEKRLVAEEHGAEI